MTWPEWLAQQAALREHAGLRRELRPRPADDGFVDLAGNDYLGLSQHPVVRAAAAEAAVTWGAGAGASRLVTGALELHRELETELAAYAWRPSALLFSTGYAANLGVLQALGGRDAFVVSDAHVHASLIDAVRVSRTPYQVAAHNDWRAVDAALDQADGRRALVLVESVYSVLGDEAPLSRLAHVCDDRGALLVVDEAHALGVLRAGLVHAAGLGGEGFVVSTATLSKAFGSQGGVVLGSQAVIDQLVNTARSFIYDTGLAPAATAAALAALRIVRDEPQITDLVELRVADLAAALGVARPDAAVLSVPMPSPQAAVTAQAAARAHGVLVGCFRPPSVPDGISRLRVTVNAGVPEPDWARAVDVLVSVVKEHG
ncbi:8-amino-7-oxononanoate synthase [Nocardioides halotolerans]|uniref:8-amino-7-oxononanoate synthase n=1 Tax=Nocardioides halotolerans TaxID=433660 RepID=UPI000411CC8D|nr:8-amino-7-oxononanoate synthase [Nocardioides halotolerans]